ncbi:hypothetical protein ACRRTK_016211 [Alexandromys fortis]
MGDRWGRRDLAEWSPGLGLQSSVPSGESVVAQGPMPKLLLSSLLLLLLLVLETKLNASTLMLSYVLAPRNTF